MTPVRRREFAELVIVVGVSVAVATLAVSLLEEVLGISNASAVYLVAVVATAIVVGTVGAVLASLASFLLYDFLFVVPYHTLTVDDPQEWLSLILLLFVGVVVGQLAGMQRTRARAAEEREREARAMFDVSRSLITRETTKGGPHRAATACSERPVAVPGATARRPAAATTPGARGAPGGSVSTGRRRLSGGTSRRRSGRNVGSRTDPRLSFMIRPALCSARDAHPPSVASAPGARCPR